MIASSEVFILKPSTSAPHASAATLLLGFVLLFFLQQPTAAAQQTWPLWESYARYAIDQQGRVIDHSANDHTTSECQSYGMFFALVANDRPRFDKILDWTQTNLAGTDLSQRLPAWSWGKGPDGNWRILDQNPASDADLWIAYDLCEAGRLWNEPRFSKLGTTMAMRIAQREVAYVPGLGTTLLSGAVGFHPTPDTWLLNPSYLPPFLLAYFAKAIPTGPWRAVLDSLHPMLAQGSGAGFAMDWVSAGTEIRPSVSPTQLASGISDKPPIGSYDAIRVYLWLGLADPATPGVRQLLPLVSGMSTYLKTHPIPPEQVDYAGRIISANAPPGFSAAVIPYLIALGLKDSATQQANHLAASASPALGLYGPKGDYYDQNLALFSTGWSEHRYRFDQNGSLKVKWH
jgi:endoglucanase